MRRVIAGLNAPGAASAVRIRSSAPRARNRVLAMSYTFGMKTAISIPDDLYLAAESLARLNHKSRSRLFSDALREYLARHSPDAVTEAMDRVCEKAGSDDYAFAADAARRVLKHSEW